ncbi:MAG: ATP-binding protein [Spirochaetaceae bacterium]|jgi:hypothetical protein|nr:ATP-binding protein [Spirochaetaceae bacterium]
MTDKKTAIAVIEALRKGTPPEKGVELYAVGNEKLLAGIRKFHLSAIADSGIIRFVNGSWGSGKTHFFRQFRELAFQENCLVSTVDPGKDNAKLDKFESVFGAIIKNVSPPPSPDETDSAETPFAKTLKESLNRFSEKSDAVSNSISHKQYSNAVSALMADEKIDIDFRRMVQAYWATLLPDKSPAGASNERGEILQWFTAEQVTGAFNLNALKKKYGVNKLIKRENAKLILGSLGEFLRFSGWNGLVVLFDETEQSYSRMSKTGLLDAHNNLLTLINNIESLPGLFLVYATTPDFYTNRKHGIVIYGALSGRIGEPRERPPSALDVIWNFDAVESKLEDYQSAAKKIRAVYITAYPDSEAALPSEEDIADQTAELFKMHSSAAEIRFWRLLTTATVASLDDHYQENPIRDAEELYADSINIIKKDAEEEEE